MKVEGSVALITGAGRGLGREIALALAGEGARVAVLSPSRDEVEGVRARVEATGGQCLPFSGDVAKDADVARFVREALAAFHRIDVLVNNAAIIGPARFMADADSSAWTRTVDVNLGGAFRCTRAVLPAMADQRRGKIINISSGLGEMPFPRFCAYSVSKAGIIQLTRSLADELRDLNIQVNAIDPGVMDTSMQEEIRGLGPGVLGREVHEQFLGFRDRGELKDPARVARLAVYLASQEADHLTGCNGTLGDYRSLGWKG